MRIKNHTLYASSQEVQGRYNNLDARHESMQIATEGSSKGSLSCFVYGVENIFGESIVPSCIEEKLE